jgi:cation transport ATPase
VRAGSISISSTRWRSPPRSCKAIPLAGAIVTWLIKLGDWIRDLTAAGTRRAISELLEFQTKTAWVIRDNVITPVPASELVAGDEVLARPA